MADPARMAAGNSAAFERMKLRGAPHGFGLRAFRIRSELELPGAHTLLDHARLPSGTSPAAA